MELREKVDYRKKLMEDIDGSEEYIEFTLRINRVVNDILNHSSGIDFDKHLAELFLEYSKGTDLYKKDKRFAIMLARDIARNFIEVLYHLMDRKGGWDSFAEEQMEVFTRYEELSGDLSRQEIAQVQNRLISQTR